MPSPCSASFQASQLSSDGASRSGFGLPRSKPVNWQQVAKPTVPPPGGKTIDMFMSASTAASVNGTDMLPTNGYDDAFITGSDEAGRSCNSTAARKGVKKSELVVQHSSATFVPKFYDTVKEIGKGSFGHCLMVRERRSGGVRVSKEVNFHPDCCEKPQKVKEAVRLEIQLLADLDHPNIVKLHEFAMDLQESRAVFVMEYVDGGDCRAHVGNSSRQPGVHERFVGQVISQVLIALEYCHSRYVLHRDIKPDNILVKKGDGRGEAVCKLVDFGLAVRRQQTLGECVGTPSYFAPEVVAERLYTFKSDVWAVGVCAVELLSGEVPFGRYKDVKGDLPKLFGAISSYRNLADLEPRLQHLSGWQQRSTEASQCFGRMLQKDPRNRPDAKTMAKAAWCQRHLPAPTGLTRQILQSLANYSGAPPPVRSCLLAIAVRSNVTEQEAFGSAFLATDIDGDGHISHRDLHTAVERARNWWDPDINTSDLVNIADLNRDGGLNYSEFVAACLYDEEGSWGRLAEDAFAALDSDRDGKLSVQQVREHFPELDNHVLRNLPGNRPFDCKEWCRAFRTSCMEFGGTEPRQVMAIPAIPCGAEFIQCAEDPEYACHQDPDTEYACQGVSEADMDPFAYSHRSRRQKKGTVECWSFPCAADDD